MLKNFFSNFSRGFFYTIGRIIAIGFIAFVLYTLFTRFPTDSIDFKSLIWGVRV